MIEKSKILSIMLISCVISSLFAISFSSGEVECECDLTEVELSIQALNSTISSQYSNITDLYNEYILLNQTLNDSIDNYNYLSDYINNVNMSVDELTDYMNEMNDTLNSIGDLSVIINNLNASIILINNSYNSLLIDFNYLYNNFTSYVSLLNSLSNVTLLIGWINGNISSIQSDISDIESDISDIESDISTIQGQITTIQSQITTIQSNVYNLRTANMRTAPFSFDGYNGFALGAIADYGWNIYVLNSDTDAYFMCNFFVNMSGTFFIYILSLSTTGSITCSGKAYCFSGTHGTSLTSWNKLNGVNCDIAHTNANTITYKATPTFSLSSNTAGTLVTFAWRKDNNAGGGYQRILGCILVKQSI